MTVRTVVFRAPCPECGGDASWSQSGDEVVVHLDDFTVDCGCASAA